MKEEFHYPLSDEFIRTTRAKLELFVTTVLNIIKYHNIFKYCSDTNFVSLSDEKCKTLALTIPGLNKSSA